ncbi:MAG: T9SS type A sorting domain-containing protein [Cytophagaceae bacterium]|nr:T9SS type A sorting domain-containing protein [Cytophagaceae bacterium]
MKQVYLTMASLGILLSQAGLPCYSQCPTDVLSGQNLVVNGDFSNGYNNWTFTPDSDGNPVPPDGYIVFNPPATQNYSQPGFILAGPNGSFFNSAFANFSDHSASADNNMLMVDGVCALGIKLWSQSGIPIKPNTNYYFSVWVHALKDNNTPPGTLRFDINGVDLGTTITAPTNLASGWILFEHVWFSGPTPPATATISIENTTTVGCDQYVDFAIDDISFIPGCQYGAAGPQPDLGADRTLCGSGGSIILSTNVTPAADLTVTWSDGTSGVGMGAPYNKTVTAAGTYSVCVTKAGSCTKTDVVNVSNTFSIDLGPDQNLCTTGGVNLNAGFTGPGVTYVWKKNGTPVSPPNNSATYFVNTTGTFSVEVTDPSCGMRSDATIISTSAPVASNAFFCPTQNVTLNVSPTNLGKYKWWNHPSASGAGNLVQKGGNTYTFSASGASNYTFYVEDTASFRTTIGPPLSNTGVYTGGPNNRAEQNETNIQFDALQAIVIDSLYMYVRIGGSCPDAVGVEVETSGGGLVGSSGTVSITPAMGCVPNTWIWVKIPVNISVPVGTNYLLKFKRPSNAELGWWEYGFTYPQTYASAVTFKGPHPAIVGWRPNSIAGMWRWVISAGNNCARVPVQAIYNCPAPVDFLDFNGKYQKSGNYLTWTTTGENGTSHFELYRSFDGINYEKIEEVSAKQGVNNHYEAIDEKSPAHAYYKVIEVDTKGRRYSSYFILLTDNSYQVLLYPNPSEGAVTITAPEMADIKIHDLMGRLMFSERINSVEVNLPRGIYVAHIYIGNQIITKEIIIR